MKILGLNKLPGESRFSRSKDKVDTDRIRVILTSMTWKEDQDFMSMVGVDSTIIRLITFS